MCNGCPQKNLENNNILTLEELSKECLILSHRYRAFLLSAFEKMDFQETYITNVKMLEQQ